MFGDVETQPGEGVLTLSDLADGMDEEEGADELPEDEEGEESESEEEQPEEDSETEDESEEEPTVTLKHDGKEVTLKQSEVVELAQKGFDYTAKTMAVAEERKAVEQERAKADEASQRNLQALEQTEDRLQAFATFMQESLGDPPPIQWAEQNAAYYLAQKQQYDDRKGQLQQALAAVEAVRQEAQRTRQAQINERAEATEKALRDTLPEWSDAKLQELAGYLDQFGISPKTSIDAFVLKGVWQLAHKAKAFDALQAEKAKLKPKAELKKVQKPSAAHTPNRADAKHADALKRYKAAPSLNTLADLMD